MTQQQAARWPKEIQALATGGIIEERIQDPEGVWMPWTKTSTPSFCSTADYECRIKPEPKLRPWRPEEVPDGCMVRAKEGYISHLITEIHPDHVSLGQYGNVAYSALAEFWIQRNGQPCGVEEV